MKINNLNSKAWYRVLQVFYILIIVITLLFLNMEYEDISEAIGPLLVVLIILEFIKRSIYYIIVGRIFPNTVWLWLRDIKRDVDGWNKVDYKFNENDMYLISETKRVAGELLAGAFDKNKYSKRQIEIIHDLVMSVHYLISHNFYNVEVEKIKALHLASEADIDIRNFSIK